MNKDFAFWQKWLSVVSVCIVAFGILMAVLNNTVLFSPFDDQVNPVFWDTADPTAPAENFRHWVYGVLGATMAGWGVFMGFIVRHPFRNKEKWAWTCLVAGLLLWFVLDTYISFASGVYFNVFFNIVLATLLGLPLYFTREDVS